MHKPLELEQILAQLKEKQNAEYSSWLDPRISSKHNIRHYIKKEYKIYDKLEEVRDEGFRNNRYKYDGILKDYFIVFSEHILQYTLDNILRDLNKKPQHREVVKLFVKIKFLEIPINFVLSGVPLEEKKQFKEEFADLTKRLNWGK